MSQGGTGRMARKWRWAQWLRRGFALAAGACILAASQALAVGLTVMSLPQGGGAGVPVTDYRWTLEEDATYHVNPGVPDPNTLSVSFHRSYMPVVAQGVGNTLPPTCGPGVTGICIDPAKHYYVSVIPTLPGTFSIGGAQIAPGQTAATVYVQQQPIPLAQISVLIFHDNFPINGAPDTPQEVGLAGFQLTLEDAGGRYGMSAGAQMMDAFGNPLGTTYAQTCGPNGTDYCYNPDGTLVVQQMGNGIILTDANGEARIKYLAPGKYGIQAVPPTGTTWQQTTTIEGTKVIDAWVKANEPPFFQEFGPPGWHVFIGFVQPFVDPAALTGGSMLEGKIVNMHLSRPPEYAFYSGAAFEHTTPWVGLNQGVGGVGPGIYAARCNPDGSFSIPNVPPGDYGLAIWDDNLDLIFAFQAVVVNPDGTCNTPDGACNFGDVPVFQWFTRLEHHVFNDLDRDGYRDAGEPGMLEVPVNLRWRDGTMYQSGPTDLEGFVPFDQVFPFFAWQVAEVDFARFKATGVTVTVDGGGAIDPADPLTWGGQLNPQAQCLPGVGYDPATGTCPPGTELFNVNTANNFQRTETGPVLAQAFQGFIGQTSVMEWGKAAYFPADEDAPPLGDFPGAGDRDWNANGVLDPAENGGISGIVFYSTTRAEDEAELGGAEVWEPGIARVQVNLYDYDAVNDRIADRNASGAVELADVDNQPLGWADGTGAKGPEDVDRDGNGSFDLGDAREYTHTDSWDDNVPTGCQGEIFSFLGSPKDCYDGLRNFNQVRPGVFDGGYAFGEAAGGYLPAGTYVVEAVPPPGYEIVKNQDKNVDFGDNFVPSLMALAQPCANWDDVDADLQPGYTVPAVLSLFPGVPAATAGQTRALCDRKRITLSDGQNAAADFFAFTHAPIAAHINGFILDDTQNEFDPAAPNFGEKYAPPWMPISIRDWTGKEIARTYSDQYGAYNALVPSTYSANLPQPSGMSPGMHTVCLNTPVKPNPAYVPGGAAPEFIPDPFWHRQYSQFCYTFQYMPGTTTYLDTPVVPVAAFAGPGQFPLDCEFPARTPVIHSVSNVDLQGPWIPGTATTLPAASRTISINSLGSVEVPNPAYDGVGGVFPRTIFRDYGFGTTAGTVQIGTVVVPAANVVWSDSTLSVLVPSTVLGAAIGRQYQIEVTRGDNGARSPVGVTLTVGGTAPVTVGKAGAMYTSIQAAIDSPLTLADSLITVAPGTYDELVVMWKPVRLQGWGAGSVAINAVKVPAEKLALWREKVRNLVLTGSIDLLPGQEVGIAGGIEPALLFDEEGSGILVLSADRNPNQGGFGQVGSAANRRPNSRIDGLTITGADHAGGIVVNGYAHYLEVANNRIVGNSGVWGGGIRIGHAVLTVQTNQGLEYQNGFNDNISIHHNQVIENAGLNGAGGGISFYTGTDAYRVTNNFICGNFSGGDGGGIGHAGLSPAGLIAENKIVFNESFNQGVTVHGGGIFVGGGAPLVLNGLSPGSGSVKIHGNLIQGNSASAGDGGGIRASRVNGEEVAANAQSRRNRASWYALDILDNIIVNNVAALAGGGISLQDAARVNILHTTVTNNDSVATAGEAFVAGTPNSRNQSTPQPAGIVSRAHTPDFALAFDAVPTTDLYRFFSNPWLQNSIVLNNRSFYFFGDPNAIPPVPYQLLPDPATPAIWDLEVLPLNPTWQLDPEYCLLTDATGYSATNVTGNPAFAQSYVNVGRGSTVLQPEIVTAIQAPPAFDEGGNFIRVRFGPLTLLRIDPATGLPLSPPVPYGDYHIQAGSAAVNAGSGTVVYDGSALLTAFPDLRFDFDITQARPNPAPPALPDLGADELY